LSHADIAAAAGVSVQSVRQARLNPNNPNFRSPPSGWRKILAQLAREREAEFHDLAEELEKGG
jgi:hypothetical protein